MKASASTLIKLSVQDTFAVFSDIPNRKKYLPTITELKVKSLLAEGKGVEWHEERTEDGVVRKGTIEITGYNKPRALTFTTHSKGLVFKTRYNFQFAGLNATKVVVSIGGRPGGILSRFMETFLSRNSIYMGEQLQKELDHFKDAIESKENL
jgi:hypothetical protein